MRLFPHAGGELHSGALSRVSFNDPSAPIRAAKFGANASWSKND